MKKKHIYRTLNVEQAKVQDMVGPAVASGAQSPWVVGIDVAKTRFVAAVSDRTGQVHGHVRFEHPRQTGRFVTWVESLQTQVGQVVGVMEPTGTYGDALRYQLHVRGVPVHRVSTKHVHDAAELYDGVPSKHDAKDASVLTWLYVQGKSKPWTPVDATRRALRARVEERQLFAVPWQQGLGKLEALLARHFPELEGVVDVKCRSILALLEKFPSPSLLAVDPEAVRALLHQTSRGRLPKDTVEAVLNAARTTCGQPMEPMEQRLLARIVSEIRRCVYELDRIDAELEELTSEPAWAPMRVVLGPTTLAVVIAYLGLPSDYTSASTFEKAAGLNLREHTSGNDKAPERRRPPGVHLTKRGPGIVRHYLFLATLRLIQTDPVARAWYTKRAAYSHDLRLKAVVALMRKLTRALVHVARGQSLDATKLFDVRRLTLSTCTTTTTTATTEGIAMH